MVERPTKKQEKYAQSIAKELGIGLPQIRTKQTYWSFIRNNEDEFRRHHSYGYFDVEDMYGIDESEVIGHILGDG